MSRACPRTDSDATGEGIADGIASGEILFEVARCFSTRPEVTACLQQITQASDVKRGMVLDGR